MTDKFYKLKDRCSFVTLPGEGLILDPENRTYHHVNESGALVLNALHAAGIAGGGIKIESLLTILKFYYQGVNDEQVVKFVKDLQGARLIEEAEKEADLPVQATHPLGYQGLHPFTNCTLEVFGKLRFRALLPPGPWAVFVPRKIMIDDF
jgi:hypothetical protein